MNNKRYTSKWEWYGVKILLECVIKGEPSVDTINNNCPIKSKSYEESIVLVKAQSFEHAYALTEKKYIDETSYNNCYDQLVEWKFVRFLDAFNLSDENLKSGTELYSRFLHVPTTSSTDEVIEWYYPETQESDEEGMDYKFTMMHKEFNNI